MSFDPYVPDREALARIYAVARCLVMPGQWETFGLVALEAAASGATIVACSNAPSAASIGTLAHTFSPGDIQGLARAIERARAAERDIATSAALAESFGWESAIASELADVGLLLERLTR